MTDIDVIVVGSGNAALCAGIAAAEYGSKVLMLEKADEALSGGNTKYTAGAMRFAYASGEALMPLITNRDDPRLPNTDFGSYDENAFKADLLKFNDGKPLSPEQLTLVGESYETLLWLSGHNIKFEPIYSRQSFEKDGKHVFWGGLTLAAHNEGVGLFDQELAAFKRLGGTIRYNSGVMGLTTKGDRVTGVKVGDQIIKAKAVILGCGGFESNDAMRLERMGAGWDKAKVRGTPHNTGDGLKMALGLGAVEHGFTVDAMPLRWTCTWLHSVTSRSTLVNASTIVKSAIFWVQCSTCADSALSMRAQISATTPMLNMAAPSLSNPITPLGSSSMRRSKIFYMPNTTSAMHTLSRLIHLKA